MTIDKETAANRAEALFTNGCNCAQAVFGAFAGEFGIDEELAKRISCGLGGGVGRLREVCGAVSGASLVLGLRHGPDKGTVYPIVQELASKFKASFGSLRCGELLAGTGATSGGKPDARTAEYYRSRPCVAFVRRAAELLAKEETADVAQD